MFAKAGGAGIFGLNGVHITVEVDICNGIPGLDIVGLPDTSVREAKDRVKSAVRNAGFEYPSRKITVNLAPADLKKDSPGLDLPIAVGILAASGQLGNCDFSRIVFAGELSLDANIREIAGVLPMAIMCREHGAEQFIVPANNLGEALLVDAEHVVGVDSLRMVVDVLLGNSKGITVPKDHVNTHPCSSPAEDFQDVQGQFAAKRALEIAAAGGHNVLMSGSPGSGKTMLARRLPSILPPMTMEEALEVTKIYSVAGLMVTSDCLARERPFRAPHHTVSAAAMAGGGRIPRPGEVTLAHNGVLFLDEFPEFSRHVLEVLRQPVEDGQVTVARVNTSYTYPSRFMLIGSMNPCPCGFLSDPFHECSCTELEIRRYARKISGPLLDRIDIHIDIPPVRYDEMTMSTATESSESISARVALARNRQFERTAKFGVFCNAQMNHRQIREFCHLETASQDLLHAAFDKMKLNARSYDRIVKVAQTIADLDHAEIISSCHMAEAIQLRSRMQH